MILNLILLIISIHAVASSEFAFDPTGGSSRDKITRTVSRDKASGDSEDYKLNKGYSSAYNAKDDPIGKGATHKDYRDDDKVAYEYEGLIHKMKQGNHRGGQGVGYRPLKNGHRRQNDQSSDTKFDGDGYNRKHQHGYQRTHGYHHRHSHISDSKDEDGNKGGDKYGGYHRVKIIYDRKENNDERDRCSYGDCKSGGYHFDDGFEYKYGNDEKGYDEHGDNEGGHDGYKDDNEYSSDYSFDHGRNKGVDDHEPYYHYEYTQSGNNYGKDYPGSAGDHHYRHHELDHDRVDHRHGLVRRNY